MNDKKITMADIARLAGVGKSTVSRYFNGGYVKDETRAKIKKVIQQYDYEPNVLAAMMKAKKTNVIGIIAPTLDSVTSSRTMMTMDEYLRMKGYTTIFTSTNHNKLRELKSIENFWRMKVDGIILMATSITMAHYELSDRLDIPIVFMGQEVKNKTSVIYDDYHAGYEIGEIVAKNGHKKVAYVGVSAEDIAVGKVRKSGIYDALHDNDIKDIKFIETSFSFDHTSKVMIRYLQTHKDIPTVFICATDNIALAVYKELISKGYKVPEDISLASFGGYESSMLITPALDTIRFENEEAGCVTAQTMIDLIEGKEVPDKQVINYVFIPGGSIKKIS